MNRIILAARIALMLHHKRAAARLEARLALKDKFPEHGRYNVGPYDIVRFDRDGGYDTRKFLAEHPRIAAQVKNEVYRKPRAEVVDIKRHDPLKRAVRV